VPDVSVIVPTQNRWGRIERSLRTALGQDGVAIEVIVVDDGSDDAAGLDRLRRRFDDDRLVGIRLAEVVGTAAARNAGLGRARGSWVAFLDDDDLWASDKLAGQLRTARDTDIAAVYSGVVLADDALRPLRVITPPDPAGLRKELLRSNRIPAGASNLLIRRETLEHLGGFDASLAHLPDWDAWIRLAQQARFAAVPETTVAYVHHKGNCGHLDPGGVYADVQLIRHRYRDLAVARGTAMDDAEITRWLAGSARRGGRRLTAARLYWRSARRDRDLGNFVRAIHTGLGLPDRATRRPPAVTWLAELRREAPPESLQRS
jgi:glycosyltransferase involved in cell wall biosynthesis